MILKPWVFGLESLGGCHTILVTFIFRVPNGFSGYVLKRLVQSVLGGPDERHELVRRVGLVQELVGEQVGRGRAGVNVDHEAQVEKVLKLGREAVPRLDRGAPVGGDEVDGAQRRLVHVRRLALDHLDRHYSERPDVDLLAVLLAGDDLSDTMYEHRELIINP